MGNEFTIKNAVFVKSVAQASAPPETLKMEIAMVGRSNVGKSSLINSLCNNNKLARISAAPGKTRQINYYRINGDFYLVDLPGYGFARASKQERESWGALMESYLSGGTLTHIFLLLDIRHEPTEEDKQMFQWIMYFGIPFTVIATKSDKIARTKRQSEANSRAKELGAPRFAIPYSSENSEGRSDIIKRIGDILDDAQIKTQLPT